MTSKPLVQRTTLEGALRAKRISWMVAIALGFCVAKFIQQPVPLSAISKQWLELLFVSPPHEDEHVAIGNRATANVTSLKKDLITRTHCGKNTTVADMLYRKVRVLCWIPTHLENHKKRALHVKRTWGQRCNKLLFISTTADEELDTVVLPIKDGWDYLWEKTKAAFKYIYEHHLDDADWFLKADDDTYVIVENLRYLLYQHSPKTPIYFGCKFKPYVEQGYMSGGAGYVLSKEALRRFVLIALPSPRLCNQQPNGIEDVELGWCLANVNVIAGDSRDALLRGRFFPLRPEAHLLAFSFRVSWYPHHIYYETEEGLNCCSRNAISFHYIKPRMMDFYDLLIYHVKPYGVIVPFEPLEKTVGKLL